MKRKQIRSFSILVCICLFVVGCTSYPLFSVEEIEDYVYNNISILENIVTDTIPTPSFGEENKDYIKEKLSDDTIVRQISRWDNGVVEFYCDGRGLSVGGTTVGFYYAPDNQPFAFEFNSCTLQEIVDDSYSWESEYGRHSFFTKRLFANWLYYKTVWQ